MNTCTHTNTRIEEDLWGSHSNSRSNTVLTVHTERNTAAGPSQSPSSSGEHLPSHTQDMRDSHAFSPPHLFPGPGSPASTHTLAPCPLCLQPSEASRRWAALTGFANSRPAAGEVAGWFPWAWLLSGRSLSVTSSAGQKRALSADRGRTAN